MIPSKLVVGPAVRWSQIYALVFRYVSIDVKGHADESTGSCIGTFGRSPRYINFNDSILKIDSLDNRQFIRAVIFELLCLSYAKCGSSIVSHGFRHDLVKMESFHVV